MVVVVVVNYRNLHYIIIVTITGSICYLHIHQCRSSRGSLWYSIARGRGKGSGAADSSRVLRCQMGN